MLLVIQNKASKVFPHDLKVWGTFKTTRIKEKWQFSFYDIQYVWNLCMNLDFEMFFVHHPMFMKITPNYFLSIIVQKHYIIGCDKGFHFFPFWKWWFFAPSLDIQLSQEFAFLGFLAYIAKKILLQILNLSKMKPF
jgi:hypothetical protein